MELIHVSSSAIRAVGHDEGRFGTPNNHSCIGWWRIYLGDEYIWDTHEIVICRGVALAVWDWLCGTSTNW